MKFNGRENSSLCRSETFLYRLSLFLSEDKTELGRETYSMENSLSSTAFFFDFSLERPLERQLRSVIQILFFTVPMIIYLFLYRFTAFLISFIAQP